MTDLIAHLRSVVQQQHTELRHSLAGLGDLQMTPSFAGQHLLTQMRWNSTTEQAKDRAFAKFMADTGIFHVGNCVNHRKCVVTCTAIIYTQMHVEVMLTL